MRGLGTIVDVLAVVVGGVAGCFLKRGLKPRYQEIILQILGLSTMFMGIAGAMSGLLKALPDGSLTTQRTMILIGSLLLGGIVGELINIERGLVRFGEWLRRRFGGGSGSVFVEGFLTATLTICVGAMAVVGSLQDGLTGDAAMLYAKSALDAVIVLIYASVYGRGVVFSAIPVGIFQGAVTALASFLAPLLSDAVILGLSFVGSVLVFCVGANLALDRKFRVSNMLPALVFAGAAMAVFG